MVDRLDHRLAAKAAEVVPVEVSDELRTRLAGLPAMIMTSGLAATGAFLLSRAESRETSPYYTTATALLDDAATLAKIPIGADTKATLDNIARTSGHQYLIAEARARMFASWLSRIANARHVKKESATEGSVRR